MGKNGVTVGTTLYTPASAPCALKSQDMLAVGDKVRAFGREQGAPGRDMLAVRGKAAPGEERRGDARRRAQGARLDTSVHPLTRTMHGRAWWGTAAPSSRSHPHLDIPTARSLPHAHGTRRKRGRAASALAASAACSRRPFAAHAPVPHLATRALNTPQVFHFLLPKPTDRITKRDLDQLAPQAAAHKRQKLQQDAAPGLPTAASLGGGLPVLPLAAAAALPRGPPGMPPQPQVGLINTVAQVRL